jgi:hypothetical protein
VTVSDLLHRVRRSIARDRYLAASTLVSFATIALVVGVVMRPWLRDLSTFGFHDWDSQTAHRELVRQALVRYREFPFWNPYACGGFPAWGYVEADTIVVSPWLMAYLALPISVALRVEVAGMALLGAVGAWMLAGRFTSSPAARALVIALWAVNGRWGLQTASGHTWHLAYAWMPWSLYFFDRACEHRNKVRDLILTSGSLAMLVYAGGIYPLPHTVLLLGLYAVGMAIASRSLRPITLLALSGLFAVGLAAPKLLPVLDGFQRAPRLIDSDEVLHLGALVTMLTSRDQSFYARPAQVTPYGWHEWGIYIGSLGLVAILAALAFVRGRREELLKAIGVLFVLLSLGAFHPKAPWTLLHELVPVFRSQHVPSRFLYPAVLVLALVAAAGLGRVLARQHARRPWLSVVAALVVMAVGYDVASVAALPMAQSMWMVPPAQLRARRPFHFEKNPPFQYKKRDWAGPMYLAMLGNTGVLNCYGTPPFDGKGARDAADPLYRGEVHVEGQGSAKLSAWSPNRAVVDLTGISAGDRLIYNMNFDESWRAEIADVGTRAVVPFDNAVSVVLPEGTSRVTFRYYPRTLNAGLALFAVAALGLALLYWRERSIGDTP